MREKRYRDASRGFEKVLYKTDVIRGVPKKIISVYADCQYALGRYREFANYLTNNKHFMHDDPAICEYFITLGKLRNYRAMKSRMRYLRKKYKTFDMSYYEYLYYWAEGNFRKINAIVAKWAKTSSVANTRFMVDLERGQKLLPQNIRKVFQSKNFYNSLFLSALYPKRKEAIAFREQTKKKYAEFPLTIETLKYIEGNSNAKKILSLVKKNTIAYQKNLLLAAILYAEKMGKKKDLKVLLQEAKNLNFRPVFPYHIINKKYKQYVK